MQKDVIEVIYSFEHPTAYLFEIKRTDLPKEADRNEKYHWFFFDRANLSLERLMFVSMTKDAALQTRVFNGAKLSFTGAQGIYSHNSGESLTLRNVSNEPLPREVRSKIYQILKISTGQ